MANERLSGRTVQRLLILAVALGAGAACAAVAGLAGAGMTSTRFIASSPPMQATHLPPLLRMPDEPVDLRYDVYCVPFESTRPDEPCAASGSTFVRKGTTGPFYELPLTEDRSAGEGRFRVVVPSAVARARDDVSYYTVFRGSNGDEVMLPDAGPAAPQLSLAMARPVEIALGAHRFGRTLPATARVAEARWGDDPDEVGIEPGADSVPLGGASFDVGADGIVHLLDEAHRRVLRWRRGGTRPEATSLAVNGTIADLAVADDGTMHVLESTANDERGPLLRSFRRDGQAISAAAVGEGASQVRIGPDGSTVVHRPASGHWLSASRGGQPLPPSVRAASGRPGRPTKSGSEVVVLRHETEIRIALVPDHGRTRSWRITSATPLAEVQLAEPLGSGVVVVARVYTASEDEFAVLVLDDRGLVSSSAVASPEWAEAAPLARFRVAGPSLYRLGSTAETVFVDRFDLQVPR
jgi:hypothetical protein